MSEILVRCEGGPADGWQYSASVEPAPEITLWQPPRVDGTDSSPVWVTVNEFDHWPHAVTYTRDPTDNPGGGERVYVPKDPA